MATETGVWDLQDVRDKQLASAWAYNAADPGQLWYWGQNSDGYLGLNDIIKRSSPTQVGTNDNWSEALGAAGNSFAIKSDGTLWSWGNNTWGRLAQNDQGPSTYRSSPTQVGTDTTWRTIATGAQGSVGIAIKTDNTLWSWGYDQSGQRGTNNSSPSFRSSPTQVPGTDWTDETSNNGSHILAIKSNGTLWAWGQRAYGMLGNNENNSPNPNGLSSPTQIGTDTTWSKACSGGGVSMMIKDDNTLWVWGSNTKGGLGLNTPQNSHRSSPTQLPGTWADAAQTGTAIHGLKTDGTLWSWGAQDGGVLGLNQAATPSDDARSSPCQIGTDTTWSKLSSGGAMGICGKTDGTWWTWGYNENGKLGHNQPNNVQLSSPTQLPGSWNELQYGATDSIIGITTG
tara:strand:- start:102 stop:1295 length:1194 start_codon:yes stop_codon:yes gene_type:complete